MTVDLKHYFLILTQTELGEAILPACYLAVLDSGEMSCFRLVLYYVLVSEAEAWNIHRRGMPQLPIFIPPWLADPEAS